jgi:hypothetical protein
MTDSSDVKRKTERLKAMKDEAKEERKKNRAAEKAKMKRIKEQQDRIEMSKDTEVWKEITKIKEMVSQQLKENKLTSAYNLKSISSIPDYFVYQHPKDTKLKTTDKDAKWVREFLNGGGTEKQLIDAAEEGRAKIWKRTKFKRPKATPKTPAKPKVSKVAGGVS